MYYQQGDVLIFSVDEIPEGCKRKINNHLAEGEVTGHFHNAVGEAVAVLEKGSDLFLDAPNGVTVEHQEHDTVKVPSGQFKIVRVLEYNHFAEEAREVTD